MKKIYLIIAILATIFTSCEEYVESFAKGKVETKEASEITPTSAKLNGEVIRKGGASDYSIGFLLYLGAEEDFTLETDGVQQIQSDKSEGAFSKTIDNLTENKTYKFRTYITNEVGTNYGEVKTFTTEKEIVKGQVTTNIADQITNNSARLNGQIVNTGNSSNYTKGFVLYTGNLSTFTLETSGVTNIVSSTSGNTYNAIANNLTQGKTYKFRAYIKNEAGESYGEVKTFIAKDAVVAGQVTTNDATEITSSQARLNGDLVSSGNSTNYTIGFLLYSGNLSTFTETTSGVQKFEVPNSKSLFNKLVTNLTEQKTYKFRTYITNEAGTSYGSIKTFTTPTAVTLGQVTTNDATNITTTTATLKGVLNSTGNSTNYTVGFLVYQGNASTFTLTTSGVQNYTITASGATLSKALTNLNDNTNYKFRAYITNEAGTSYGDVKTFTTQTAVTLGQVTTNNATNITTTTATLKGVLNSTGNSTNYTVGFLVYQGSVSNFTLTTSGVQNYTTTASGTTLSKALTNLNDNTNYKFRTYITNEAGTSYGDVKTFTTPTAVTLGQVTTNNATNITTTTATLKGVLNSTGNSTNYTVGFLLYQGSASDFTLTTSGVQNYTTTASGTTLSKALTNLNDNTNYKFRTYITNEAGTNYGSIKTFTTEEEIPELSFVCLRILTGHTGWGYSASYSPDGTKIVSASGDETIKIWNANTGSCLQTLTGHTNDVNSASYSPDGTKIVSASGDTTIKIWNANTGSCLQTLTGHTSYIVLASYSPDGTKIVSASYDKTIKIWDANTGTCLKTLTGHTLPVTSASYSPDGTKIVSASSDNTIKIWDANTGTCLQTLTGHTNYVRSASYSPDGTKIVSASQDKTIKIWDANTGTCLQTLTGHTETVKSASYSPDGTKIVSASYDKSIKIWDANTGTCLQTLTGHTAAVYSASYSPDGTKIVSASYDNTIKIWGLE